MTAPLIFTPEYYRRMRCLEAEGWWNAAMRDIATSLLTSMGMPTNGTMLDVGCGSGQTIDWFTRTFANWRALGVDLASEGVSAARRLGCNAVLGSALSLPYADASVDLVITLDVLQHLPLGGGDLVAMREMRRVLSPRGLLLIRTNAQAFPRIGDDQQYNFHKYETGELRAKLQSAGFEVLRLGRVNALLGLAEIPRELRAARANGKSNYRGILAAPMREPVWTRALKRRWLRIEGLAVRRGVDLPLGRSILALCRNSQSTN